MRFFVCTPFTTNAFALPPQPRCCLLRDVSTCTCHVHGATSSTGVNICVGASDTWAIICTLTFCVPSGPLVGGRFSSSQSYFPRWCRCVRPVRWFGLPFTCVRAVCRCQCYLSVVHSSRRCFFHGIADRHVVLSLRRRRSQPICKSRF